MITWVFLQITDSDGAVLDFSLLKDLSVSPAITSTTSTSSAKQTNTSADVTKNENEQVVTTGAAKDDSASRSAADVQKKLVEQVRLSFQCFELRHFFLMSCGHSLNYSSI